MVYLVSLLTVVVLLFVYVCFRVLREQLLNQVKWMTGLVGDEFSGLHCRLDNKALELKSEVQKLVQEAKDDKRKVRTEFQEYFDDFVV